MHRRVKMSLKQLVCDVLNNILVLISTHLVFIKKIIFVSGVLATIKHFKFIIYLFILHDVLKIINILSVQLQSKLATLGSSVCLINGVKETLKKNRSTEYFSELWKKIVNFAENNDISINIPILGTIKLSSTTNFKLHLQFFFFNRF